MPTFPFFMRMAGGGAVAITCLVLGGGGALPSATTQAWLKAFNAGDMKALKALGDENTDFDRDAREETGGLDLLDVESGEGNVIKALLRERISPETWHVTLIRDAKRPAKFSDVSAIADPMPSEKAAIAALDAFGSRMKQKDKFSGVLLVRKDGRDLLAKAYGHADAGEKVPNTLDTEFFFASQGKMFTAVAIFQLIEKGRISLTDTVGKFLTHYPNREIAKKVTVRMLLSHTGGTGEMGILLPENSANRARVHSIADIIALNGKRGPFFKPGTKWDYSNYGYILLGAMVEKASGMDFYDYVQRNIFARAHMTHTGYPLHDDMAGIAVPLTPKNRKLVSAMDQWPWRGTPAGGGVSTAGDMARFIGALNAGKLISKTSLKLATHAAGGFGFRQGNGFGLGFIESGINGLKYWGHGGGAPGDSVVLDYYPQTHVTFVCMANREPPACDRLAINFLFRWPRQK
ncbi:MAG TPA: serine hydrolase domain-containing protein [Rhizomicrobium sp.]|jgi:CubicO group peptidase (beta-lactamase class C family)|nr:serine hydrolase domain-containing protein [Rhizomicrobium sp.]